MLHRRVFRRSRAQLRHHPRGKLKHRICWEVGTLDTAQKFRTDDGRVKRAQGKSGGLVVNRGHGGKEWARRELVRVSHPFFFSAACCTECSVALLMTLLFWFVKRLILPYSV